MYCSALHMNKVGCMKFAETWVGTIQFRRGCRITKQLVWSEVQKVTRCFVLRWWCAQSLPLGIKDQPLVYKCYRDENSLQASSVVRTYKSLELSENWVIAVMEFRRKTERICVGRRHIDIGSVRSELTESNNKSISNNINEQLMTWIVRPEATQDWNRLHFRPGEG